MGPKPADEASEKAAEEKAKVSDSKEAERAGATHALSRTGDAMVFILYERASDLR